MLSNKDRPEALALVRRMIELVGDDPDREGVRETPERVVRSWGELFSGYGQDAAKHAKVFDSESDQVVVVHGIEYHSFCEHHMLPFHGQCAIAYLPDGKVLGASKFVRIVGVYARRLQIQENLTAQIADAIQEVTQARGVAVMMDGLHMCMRMRGVLQAQSRMRTSCMLGTFRDDAKARSEVVELLLKE